MSFTKWASLTCASALALAPAIAQAEGVSGSVAAFGGGSGKSRNFLRSKSLSAGVVPSLYVPLGSGFGVQGDGIAARHRGRTYYGGGLHLSRAVGDSARIGLYGSAVGNNGRYSRSVWRVGGETIFNVGPFTLAAVAGYEKSKRSTVPALFTPRFYILDATGNGGRFFDMVDVRLAVGEKGYISVGHRYVGGRHAGAGGLGVNLIPNLAAFAEGRVGGGGYRALWGGLKFSFGGGTQQTALNKFKRGNAYGSNGLTGLGSLGGGPTDPINLLDDLYAGDNSVGTLTIPAPNTLACGYGGPCPPPPPVT